MASFPIQSQYKVSKIHTLNPTPREGREEERREGERGAREKECCGLGAWQKEREGERREGVRGYLWCPRRGPKYPLT